MSDYWQRQTEGFDRGLSNIATALIQQPRTRAQADLMRRQGSAAIASADLNTERARELIQKGNLVEALQHTAPLAMKAYQEGKLDDPSIGEFTGAAAALTGQNKDDVQQSFKKGLGTLMAMSGKTPLAAAVENPVSVNNNQVNADERANRPLTVGGALMSPGGRVLGVAPKVVPAGSMLAGAAEGTNAPPVVVNNPKAPVGERTPEAKVARDRFVAGLLNKETDPAKIKAKLDAYDAQTQSPSVGPISSAMSKLPFTGFDDKPDPAPLSADELKAGRKVPVGGAQPAQKPSRALARQYVNRFGDKATDILKADGYDTSGYAD